MIGERGTGKQLCTAAIHQASKHAVAPFAPIDFTTIPLHLFESELFSVVSGQFTGGLKDSIRAAEQA